jgi:acetoin utilization deacetylase AcuC-like enzyme
MDGLSTRLKAVMPEAVTPEMIRAVHTQHYMDILQWISGANQRNIRLDADTYADSGSYEIARLSAGGVVRAVDEVLSGKADNGLAAVRPPGHHAMPDHAMGFCILSNVAIAARYAQSVYGIERVMVVDYDVHHGNGTEAAFYDDSSVLFISTHQYPFYPGTGSIEETGAGKGVGCTINIPLSAGHGDHNYSIIFRDVIWPAAERYQPQLILVSAGFDAHWNDPLAMMALSLKGYDHLARELIKMAQKFCGGKIVFALEGGYNLEALGHGVRNIACALLEDSTISDPLGLADNLREPEIKPLIDRLRKIHGPLG